MTIELVGQYRKYYVECDVCGENGTFKAQNKIILRDMLRDNDWSLRELGFVGIMECTCPECMKKRKNNAN